MVKTLSSIAMTRRSSGRKSKGTSINKNASTATSKAASTSNNLSTTPTLNKTQPSVSKQSPKPRKKKQGTVEMVVGTRIFKVSAKILKEIRQYQISVQNLIPKLPFARLIQEIIIQYVPEGRRIQREALEALQEAAECYLTQYFEDSYACTLHARRSTLIPRDMGLVQFLRKSI